MNRNCSAHLVIGRSNQSAVPLIPPTCLFHLK